jgi:hypothetical protein
MNGVQNYGRPSYYLTAQICLNGHTITHMYEESPERAAPHCDKCGDSTITQCPDCDENIRGYHRTPGVAVLGGWAAPAFCHSCGTAYPWTVAKLREAKDFADQVEELTPEERTELRVSVDHLVRDTPGAETAIMKVGRLMDKAGPRISGLFQNILAGVVTEVAKKGIWGG